MRGLRETPGGSDEGADVLPLGPLPGTGVAFSVVACLTATRHCQLSRTHWNVLLEARDADKPPAAEDPKPEEVRDPSQKRSLPPFSNSQQNWCAHSVNAEGFSPSQHSLKNRGVFAQPTPQTSPFPACKTLCHPSVPR